MPAPSCLSSSLPFLPVLLPSFLAAAAAAAAAHVHLRYFARFPIDKHLVRMILQQIQSDDIYKGAEAFPSPEHRSTRLSAQAGMLFVILFFAPDLLHTSDASMRETVSGHASGQGLERACHLSLPAVPVVFSVSHVHSPELPVFSLDATKARWHCVR